MELEQRHYTNEELLKLDPFIKYWETNYSINLKNGVFSWENAKPLLFLKNIRPYQRIPVVIVAAGPSLDKNIHILKEFQSRCLIICVDIVLFKLIENGIRPDFVINIDPHPETTSGWKDLEGDLYDTSDLTLVCPTTANYEALCNWKGGIIFYNQSDDLKNHKGPFLRKLTKITSNYGSIDNSLFIGATAFQFAGVFNPSCVLLMGYDFAYSDNKAFCDGVAERKSIHHFKTENLPITKEAIETRSKALHEFFISTRDLVAKIDTVEIPTTKLYRKYLEVLDILIKKSRMLVINCTEGGILASVPIAPLESVLKKFCINEIKKRNIFDSEFPIRQRRGKHR